MTIGALARAAEVGVETIRYYERLGLLARPVVLSGYRRYSQGHLTRLRYIRSAKALQLSLKDIAKLQSELTVGPQFCASVRAHVTDKLGRIDRQLGELAVLREQLTAFLKACRDRPPDQPCSVRADLLA